MAQYKSLKTYYSESQKRVLKEGEVFSVTDDKLIADLDESIKKHGTGFLEKLVEKTTKRTKKAKEEVKKEEEENNG